MTDPLHFLTLEETAELTGLSRDLIRDEIARGRIRAVLVGRKGGHDQFKIPRRSIETWVEDIATGLAPSHHASQTQRRNRATQGGTRPLRAVP